MAYCLHTHVTKVDPTRTTVLRRRYEREMVRRFKRIRKAIVEAIVLDDVFGLQTGTASTPIPTVTVRAKRPGRRAFAFTRSDRKVQAFIDWVIQAESEDVLGVTLGTPIRSAANQSWQNIYLQSAYQKGMAASGANLKKAGVEVADSWLEGAFMRPVHADRAGLIFTRTYTSLAGITDAMDNRLSRTLAQGIVDGKGARELAKDLAKDVDVSITRARALARTETISAHAEASLNSYKEAGIEGVQVLAEFATAEDDRVCPQCQELDRRYGANGNPLPIDEAGGIIPVHPNCRCAWVPVVVDPEGKALR